MHSCHGSSLHVPHACGKATVAQVSCCVREWDPTWSRLLGSSVASGPRECSGTWLPRPFAINFSSLFFQPWEGAITYFFLGDTACLLPYCLQPFLAFGQSGTCFSLYVHLYIHLLFLEFFCPSVVVYKCYVPLSTSIASSCSFLTFLTPVHAPALVSGVCVKTSPWHTRSASDIKSQSHILKHAPTCYCSFCSICFKYVCLLIFKIPEAIIIICIWKVIWYRGKTGYVIRQIRISILCDIKFLKCSDLKFYLIK